MVALQEERRRLVGKGRAKACTLGDPQMKWFWEAKKGLEPLTFMADVSLAAMAGVTAGGHERISKFCTP